MNSLVDLESWERARAHDNVIFIVKGGEGGSYVLLITIFVCLSNKNPDAVGSALEGDLEEYLVGLQVSRMGATTQRQLSTPPLTQTQLGLLPFKT